MELGFILLKTLPKAISMYMALEEVLGVQFTKTDLVTFATGKRSLVLIYFDKNHIRAGFIFQNFGGQGLSWTILGIQELRLALSPVIIASIYLIVSTGQPLDLFNSFNH